MSWRDRPYSGDDAPGEVRVSFRRPGSVVTWLIVVNVVVFVLQQIGSTGLIRSSFFGLSLHGIQSWRLWQPVSYMFLHADVWHILFNMLGLYVFGTEFERTFGWRRFVQFYAACGIIGGLAYLALGAMRPIPYSVTPVIGASGAIYGLLFAAMIFWPHMQVILFLFPVPIRVFGLIWLAILFLQGIGGGGIQNLGGEVCHLAGAIAGIGVLYAWGIMPAVRLGAGRGFTLLPGSHEIRTRGEGAWARKQKQLAEEQAEVDRILRKVHDEGLASLSRREKKTLARATQLHREREQHLHRSNRL